MLHDEERLSGGTEQNGVVQPLLTGMKYVSMLFFFHVYRMSLTSNVIIDHDRDY